MNDRMPQLKNQALRFVLFLVGSLSIIFLVIIFVITSKFYDFHNMASAKKNFLENLDYLENRIFELGDESVSAGKSESAKVEFFKSIKSLKAHHGIIPGIFLINDIEQNFILFEKSIISRRQFFNNVRNDISKIKQLVEEQFIEFTLNYSKIQKEIIVYSLAIFFLCAVFLLLVSHRWLGKITNPILSLVNELLKVNNFSIPLALPRANYFEQDQLNKTLGLVWEDLRVLDKIKRQEIRAKNIKIQTILNSMDDLVFFINASHKLALANDHFLNSFNLTEAQLDIRWDDVQLSEKTKVELNKILFMGFDQQVEIFLSELEKSYICRKKKVIDDVDSTFYGTVYMMQDNTEIAQQQKIQREFVGVLSHELKTPIQSLTTASELLIDFQKDFSSPDFKMLSDTVCEDVRKVKAIAEDFVRFSKSDFRNLLIKEDLVDFVPKVVEIIAPLRSLTADKKISIELELKFKEKLMVYLDPLKFSWAISNIVLNAYRVSPINSKISLIVSKHGHAVELKVCDEGPGIEEDEKEGILRPFYQGKKKGSLGLGLAIAKQVIDAHDGSLEYMNNEPKGAIFIIKLPLVEKSNA